MTIDELRAHLRRVHADMGGEGRLSFTLGQEPGEPCYVTHWVKAGHAGYEDCKAVGMGTVEECLAALDRYAAGYRRKPTAEEVGRMLGLVPVKDAATAPGREVYRIAAE